MYSTMLLCPSSTLLVVVVSTMWILLVALPIQSFVIPADVYVRVTVNRSNCISPSTTKISQVVTTLTNRCMMDTSSSSSFQNLSPEKKWCGFSDKRLESTTTETATTSTTMLNRRSVFDSMRSTVAMIGIATSVTTTLAIRPSIVYAIPMVTIPEFESILRDSSRSIEQVEFSGPRSESVVVKLIDGTTFGIADVIESTTDPRSPLKIAASCKAYQVPVRFVDLENIVASTPRRKKDYSNERVLQAETKQREKRIRMQQDEELRQSELASMRGQ